MKKHLTIKITPDDKYFENKEIKEQLKKMKKLMLKLNKRTKYCQNKF